MNQNQLPIIQKLIAAYKLWHEFVSHIPKTSRYTLGAKIDTLFLNVIELVFAASYKQIQEKIIKIGDANAKLGALKLFIQVGWEIKILDTKRYISLSEKLDEIGRIFGGWKRGLEMKLPANKGQEEKGKLRENT